MGNDTKILLVIGSLTLVALIGGALFLSFSQNKEGKVRGAVSQDILVKEESYFKGPKDAKVTIVEFADFQCPACAVTYPTIKQVANTYNDKVRIVFRHFPLENIHKNAQIAAEAAEAAGEQGKFWEMHDKIFEGQSVWAESNNAKEIFKIYAKELGLNEEQFDKALESEKFEDKIFVDYKDGEKAEVSGTPTCFINGKRMSEGLSFNDFKREIEALL